MDTEITLAEILQRGKNPLWNYKGAHVCLWTESCLCAWYTLERRKSVAKAKSVEVDHCLTLMWS